MTFVPVAPIRKRHRLVSNVGLMVVASLVLSFASYYTTFVGMQQYVSPEDWPLAAAITFGIQAFMFATAWIASQSIGTSFSAFLAYFVFYLLAASVSVFFSFSSLFNSIFDADQRDQVNATFMRNFYQETATGLSLEVRNAVVTEHRSIIEGDLYRSWQANVQSVITLQRSAPDLLRERFEVEREKKALELAELSKDVAVLVAQREQLESERRRLTDEVRAVDVQIGAERSDLEQAREAVRELRSRISILEAQMEAERTGVGSKAGEGPKFKRLRDERDALARDLIPFEVTLENSGASDSLLRERQQLVDQLQASSAGLAEVGAQIGALEGRQAVLQETVNAASLAISPNTTSAISDIETSFRLASAQPEDFAAKAAIISSTCSKLLEELRSDPQISDQTAGMSCDLGNMQSDVNRLVAALAREVDFRHACQPERTPDLPDGHAFKVLAEATEACFIAAGVQQSATRDELARLVSSRGPSAHPFVVAQNALFIDKLPVAYMAGVIAVVMDLLILMVAIMAQMVESSREEKAIRALQDVRFEGDGNDRVAYVDILPGSSNYTERKKIAVELVSQNLAYFDDTKSRLYLGRDGREYLNRRLAAS